MFGIEVLGRSERTPKLNWRELHYQYARCIACALVGVVIANIGAVPDTPGLDALINLAR